MYVFGRFRMYKCLHVLHQHFGWCQTIWYTLLYYIPHTCMSNLCMYKPILIIYMCIVQSSYYYHIKYVSVVRWKPRHLDTRYRWLYYRSVGTRDENTCTGKHGCSGRACVLMWLAGIKHDTSGKYQSPPNSLWVCVFCMHFYSSMFVYILMHLWVYVFM
jgi:hypothetical protein